MEHQRISRYHKTYERYIGPILGGALLAYLLYCSYPYVRARQILYNYNLLEVGHSSSRYVGHIAESVGAEPAERCVQNECTWLVAVDNGRLPKWWRRSGDTLLVSFTVTDSVLTEKVLAYGKGLRADGFSPSSIAVTERQSWGRSAMSRPIVSGWQTTNVYRYYEFVVHIGPGSTRENRQSYNALNLDCFWRLGGCTDAREMLPIAAHSSLPPTE